MPCGTTGEGPLLEEDEVAAVTQAVIAGASRRVRVLAHARRVHGVLGLPGTSVSPIIPIVLGDEARAMQYGLDTERDVAAFVERIGPDRWRLIMPRPHFESQMDVMELVPSSPGVR